MIFEFTWLTNPNLKQTIKRKTYKFTPNEHLHVYIIINAGRPTVYNELSVTFNRTENFNKYLQVYIKKKKK